MELHLRLVSRALETERAQSDMRHEAMRYAQKRASDAELEALRLKTQLRALNIFEKKVQGVSGGDGPGDAIGAEMKQILSDDNLAHQSPELRALALDLERELVAQGEVVTATKAVQKELDEVVALETKAAGRSKPKAKVNDTFFLSKQMPTDRMFEEKDGIPWSLTRPPRVVPQQLFRKIAQMSLGVSETLKKGFGWRKSDTDGSPAQV